jgi:hypothetical protein
MKRLVLACVVAAAASQAAGCIITSGDDDGDELALITSRWDFHTAAGARLDCPPGFDTVEIVSTGPENLTDLHDCIDFEGTNDYIPGVYAMEIIVTNDARTNDYASSLLFTGVDVTNLDATVTEDFIDDGGRLQIGVDLVTTGTNTPETCASGGVDTIVVDITGGAVLRDELFDCDQVADNGLDFSDPLVEGDYDITITATDSAGGEIGPGTTDQVTMLAPNDYPEDLIGIEVGIDP